MSHHEGCYTCSKAAPTSDREAIWLENGWRVAHSFNSSLAGWTVVVPTRHVEALGELSGPEVAALGPLLRDLSLALEDVTGCEKTYVILLAEAEGFHHLHFHVIPRRADLPPERRGTGIFAYLKETPLSDAERDRIARDVRGALERRRGLATSSRRDEGVDGD